MSPSFGLDRFGFLNETLAGYPAWQYAATALWFLLAISAAWLAGWLIMRELSKAARKTTTLIDDELVWNMRGPVRTAIFVVFCYYGIPMFQWPDSVIRLLQNLFFALVTFSIAYAFIKMVDVAFRLLELRCEAKRIALNREMFPVFRKICKTVIFLLAALMFLDNVGINIKAVLAGLGIGGLAVALAAQDVLSNFFASLVIIFDSPYRVGERIKAKGHEGVVEGIGFRSTRIRTAEGSLVSIPNKQMADTDINNLSRRTRGSNQPSQVE